MKVAKPAIGFSVFLIAVGVTGCSLVGGEGLDVNHDRQASLIEASSSNTNLPKNATAIDDRSENSNSRFDEQPQKAENSQAAEKQTVYFLHDSIEIDAEFVPMIEKQTQELLENSAYALILEGHADERGSREYNIGLGEERAKAVAKIMQARGVRSNQLEIVSYGEEKPASLVHTETAWHLNRRVNLILQRTQK